MREVCVRWCVCQCFLQLFVSLLSSPPRLPVCRRARRLVVGVVGLGLLLRRRRRGCLLLLVPAQGLVVQDAERPLMCGHGG